MGYTLPAETVSSEEIEQRLSPLYERLRLPEGRLELMTGIRERRFFPAGTRVGSVSVSSGDRAIEAAGIDRNEIGALIHGSVCRDHLEPATAAGVHHHLRLSSECHVFDISNACLGVLTGALQIANLIELGQIRAGLVVGTENGRQLVEHTIDSLNRDTQLTRKTIKTAVASLTIGSSSCAMLLADESLCPEGSPLLAGAVRADTRHHQLCQSGSDEAGADMRPLMATDSERLMREGVATGAATFEHLLAAADWTRADLQRTFCHQVGSAHRKMMLESLGLPVENDFCTLEWLGNTGSAALPTTLAIGAERQFIEPGQQAGLLGIGSGIHCVMLAAEWAHTPIVGGIWNEGDEQQKPTKRFVEQAAGSSLS